MRSGSARREPTISVPAAEPAATPPPPSAPDLRSISPKNFASLVHELYLEGNINWDEYRLAGFPSELNPRFDETIGALTGERAEPDRPKDMLASWERRVEFMRRYQPGQRQTEMAQRVLKLLVDLAGAATMVA